MPARQSIKIKRINKNKFCIVKIHVFNKTSCVFYRRTVGACDIFTSHNPNLVPRTVLVEGSGGVGKSLWCHYLAYMWAQDTPVHPELDKYKLIFILDQRESTGKIEQDIVVQNFSQHYRGTPETIERILEKHAEDILFIVDGFEYDENREDTVTDLATGKYIIL